MKIGTKIKSGFAILGALVLGCGGAGLYGISSLSESLDYLAGPAWNTADGAMEGTIEIESQMLAINKITSGNDVAKYEQQLIDAKAGAGEALGRLIEANLISPASIENFNAGYAEYNQRIDNLLASFETFDTARTAFNTHTEMFVELGEVLEGIGDGAVETLEANPDQKLSWNEGIQEKWNAADGGMESNIGLLTELYHVERLVGGKDFATEKASIENAFEFHGEATATMLSTSTFDIPADPKFGAGKSYSQAYSDTFEEYKALMGTYIDAYVDFNAAREQYDATTESFLGLIAEFEEEGDATVEGAAAGIEASKLSAKTAIYIAAGGSLLAAFFGGLLITRSITGPLSKLVVALRDIAEGEGDLTQRVDENSTDELGEVGTWFNAFITKVQDLVSEVTSSVNEVASTATQIAATSEEMDRGMQEQAEQATRVSAAVEQMSSTVTEVAGKSSSAASDAENAGEQATNGGQIVHQTIESMTAISQVVNESAEAVAELGKRGEQIGEVINVINDIADQTNLLALNAAIEAARAGEHGRGFAVVADEVRKLAERTTTATEEVGESIKAIQDETSKAVQRMSAGTDSVSQGVELAEQAGNALQSIVEGSKGVAGMIQSIASAASEQASATDDIARNVETINAVSRQSSEATSQSAHAASQLSIKAEHLQSIISRFKIEGGNKAA